MRLALMLLLGLGPTAPPDGPERWILAYAGTTGHGVARYTTNEFTRLFTQVDSAGRSTSWICSGAIVLSIYAPDGDAFAT